MTKNFNKEPHFLITYGDNVKNDGRRLSDYIVNKLSKKETQNYIGVVVASILVLGSQVEPVNSIPAEYNEAANNVVQGINQAVLPLGYAAVVANVDANAAKGNQLPGQVDQAGRINLNNPPIQPNQNHKYYI